VPTGGFARQGEKAQRSLANGLGRRYSGLVPKSAGPRPKLAPFSAPVKLSANPCAADLDFGRDKPVQPSQLKTTVPVLMDYGSLPHHRPRRSAPGPKGIAQASTTEHGERLTLRHGRHRLEPLMPQLST
jgi:hypothetical protein